MKIKRNIKKFFTIVIAIYLSLFYLTLNNTVKANDIKVSDTKTSSSNNISQSLVITSDPQYPWTEIKNNPEEKERQESEELIRSQYNSINEYTNSVQSNSNIIINGDITAYGHSWQRNKMKNELLPILNRPYYYGLGNHDIENPEGDCLLNSCASGSMIDYYNFLESKKKVNPTLKSDLKLNSESQMGTVNRVDYNYRGSLVYSVDFGNIHSIQLNNYPRINKNFQNPPLLSSIYNNFYIKENLEWLENDLKKARAENKIIIINVHKPNQDSWSWNSKGTSSDKDNKFKNLLNKYGVSAVFAGHIHSESGRQKKYDSSFGDIPVFLSGSASTKTYLIAEQVENNLNIYLVTNNDSKNKKLEETIDVNEPDLNTSLKLSDNLIKLTLNKNTQEAKNRIIIYVNGQYVAESYKGISYYASVNKDNPNVNIITKNIHLKENDLVEVYLTYGKPGDDPSKNNSIKLLTSIRYQKLDNLKNITISTGIIDNQVSFFFDKAIQESDKRIIFYVNDKYAVESYKGTVYSGNGYIGSVNKNDPDTNVIFISNLSKGTNTIEIFLAEGKPGDDFSAGISLSVPIHIIN